MTRIVGFPEASARRLVAAGRPVRLARGEVIFHQGDAGDETFLIVRGRVRIRRAAAAGWERVLSLLGPGAAWHLVRFLAGRLRRTTVSNPHPSLVATAATADPDYTAQERANIELILALRAAPFAERRRFLHPDLRHHRRGFAFLAELSGLGTAGYTAQSISDRVDTIEDIIAKDDRVWAVWTLHGRHTGPLFGIPATGRQLDVLELGVWRIQDNLVAEAWFFGDELTLLRQLGYPVSGWTSG